MSADPIEEIDETGDQGVLQSAWLLYAIQKLKAIEKAFLAQNAAILEDQSVSSGDGQFLQEENEQSKMATLKLRPEFARPRPKPDSDTELERVIAATLNHPKNLSKKERALFLQRQLEIYQNFILFLKNTGKSHLIPDCLFDRKNGVIQFLSLEVVAEFIKFMPNAKLTLRASNRECAFQALRDFKVHGFLNNIAALHMGNDLMEGLPLADFKNRAFPVPVPRPSF